MKQNTTVTELNFHGNSLGVQGAETLAGMLKTNRTLTALNLGGNGITSAGAKSIADSLYFNGGPALRVLQLGGAAQGAGRGACLRRSDSSSWMAGRPSRTACPPARRVTR